MSELKPCPHCKVIPVTKPAGFGNGQIEYTRFSCACYFEKITTIEKWNTRPIEDAQSAEIERLKAYNARMREALEWLVNLSCGYSSANEYTDAVILGMQALKGGE